jgi:hypothetical protein
MPMNTILYYRNDVVKNENFEKVTLDKGIPHKINPKTIPKKVQAFAVRINSFPADDKDHPAEKDYGCDLDERHSFSEL